MTTRNADRPELSPRDAAFVREIESLTRAPEMTAAQRVAFSEDVDRRVAARRSAGWLPALAGMVAVGAAVALALFAGPDARPPSDDIESPRVAETTPAPRVIETAPATTTPVEALLSLAEAEESDLPSDDDTLPDDYAAIASLILDG
ncbi:MAG: hypothetical protein AAF430_25635 [Myxococcota bacterium]